jgi:hypothetical protein
MEGEGVMTRVICSQCTNEDGAFCTIKKAGVKINKRRNCETFELDVSKVKEKQSPETIKAGPYYWMEKSELKRLIRQQEREEIMRKEIYGKHKPFDPSEYSSTAE